MEAEGSNRLLPAARRKGHREGVGKEDWTDRGGRVPEMWGGRTVRRVRNERGRGEEGMGEGECIWDEVG